MLSASGPPPNNPSKPKLVICKCSHQNCDNHAVQGGVCITHGTQQKCCAHPGCDKAVKLSHVYCSAHGLSRRKCDHEGGCSRVAVQGGRCISHGARKRVCCYPGGLSNGENRGGQGPCNKNGTTMTTTATGTTGTSAPTTATTTTTTTTAKGAVAYGITTTKRAKGQLLGGSRTGGGESMPITSRIVCESPVFLKRVLYTFFFCVCLL